MKGAKTTASNYVVKPLDSGDLDRAIEIWSMAFGFMDRDRWAMFYDSFLDFAVGAYLDDYLVCVVGIINFQMWFGDKLMPCAGVSAVAADPAHRRRGLVRQCMKEALRESHRKRVPLAALWPFSYPFYRRMGFEVTDMQYVIETPANVLPDIGDAREYRRFDVDQYEHLKPIHEEWIKQNNLSIKRGDLQWRRLLSHPERTINGFAHKDGYMLWNVKDKASRILEVIEWAWLTRHSFLDGLSLLHRMNDLNWDKVRWRCSDIAPLIEFGISDPHPTITVKPGLMTRVLHVGAFMESLDVDVSSFTISDPLGVSEGYKSGTKGSNGGGGDDPVGPGELIQSITGFLNVKPDTVPRRLHNLVGHKQNFSIEFF